MDDSVVKKNGLIYSSDMTGVLGIDTSSNEFTGAVPDGVQWIEEEAFSCCALKSISLPDSVFSVGANLFCNSTALETVHLGQGLKNLSPFMFCGCTSLKSIDIPQGIREFTEGLFNDCKSLKDIPFRPFVNQLPEDVISGCDSLETLVIPDTITKICRGAIHDCPNLKTIVIGSGLENCDPEGIKDCPNLCRIRISDDNKFFHTDEKGWKLYRKEAIGSDLLLLEVPCKIENQEVNLKELEEDENPSIIKYEDENDETDDGVVLFNNDSQAEEGKSMENETPNNQDDVEARLQEIMGQGKLYDEGDFTIMDIPEASEEEMEASILPSMESSSEAGEEVIPEASDPEISMSLEKAKEAVTARMSGPVDETPMDEKLQEIMAQDKEKNSFSIMDIPAASDDELAEGGILSEGDVADGVESADTAIPVVPTEKIEEEERKTEEDEQKNIMHNLFFESDKVEQHNLEHEGATQRILYVFAEELATGQFGKAFSKRLTKCCTRLADIHKFTSIFFFYGVDVENDKFRGQFQHFMENKDTVLACSSSTLASLTQKTKTFAGIIGIQLDKDNLNKEIEKARTPGSQCLKLLIQDNLAD